METPQAITVVPEEVLRPDRWSSNRIARRLCLWLAPSARQQAGITTQNPGGASGAHSLWP
jgi:hypothetical protein